MIYKASRRALDSTNLGHKVVNQGTNVGGVAWDDDRCQLLGSAGRIQPGYQPLQAVSSLSGA